MHLPRSLSARGIEVACLAHPGSVLTASRFIAPLRVCAEAQQGFAPLRDIVRELATFEADLVIPVDEAAIQVLDMLLARVHAHGDRHRLPAAVLALIERSLGRFNHFSRHGVRRTMAKVARDARIPAPATAPIDDPSAARAFAALHGYPIVIKAEQSSAGVGVFVVDDEHQIDRFFAQTAGRQAHELAVAQAFCRGTLAMHTVFAWRGRVLAGVGAVQLQRRHVRPTAPSSAVRLLAHSPMARSCAAFVESAGLSGFHSWDFIVPPVASDRLALQPDDSPLMIEHNPRPIAISHLGDRVGSDLIGALADQLAAGDGVSQAAGPQSPAPRAGLRSDASTEAAPAALDIAFFPDEWRRDPSSPLLVRGFHDVPWDDPAIVTRSCTIAIH